MVIFFLIYFWLCWVFIALLRPPAFSSCGEWGATLDCGVWASHWGGFSGETQALGRVVVARRLSSWGSGSVQFSSRMQVQQLWHLGSVALSYKESSWTRDWIHVPCIGRWILIPCTTKEVQFLIFWGTSILLSIVDEPIYTLPSTVREGSLFSTYLPVLFISCHFDDCHFKRCEVISHCGSDLYVHSD